MAVGSITVNVMICVSGLIQIGLPAVVTLTNVTVVFVAYVPVKVAVPVAFNSMV